jgi:hypothetical protein
MLSQRFGEVKKLMRVISRDGEVTTMATSGDGAMKKRDVEGDSMARRPKMKNTMPVRLADEAVRIARIAAGYTGESMAEYVSRITCERGREDIDALHQKMKEEKPPETNPLATVPVANGEAPKAKKSNARG